MPKLPSLSADEVANLNAELCAWFARSARDLPWRRTRDPYAIWISESMLQQTRVETVREYWQRFLGSFPNVQALAAADEEDVLAAWSGLGYYRRARALHAAARAIVADHAGVFPSAADLLATLPGIGPYTAGAVASIAFDCPEPLVDGNVGRVFARLFALEEPLGSAASARELWKLARELVPSTAPGAWNQALMELGATVCTPTKPRCGSCPVAGSCRARELGRTAELPRRAEKPEPVDVALEIAVVLRGGEILAERRPATGRMAGLWQLPTRELVRPGREPRLFPASWPATAQGAALFEIDRGLDAPDAPWGELKHGITRHRIRAALVQARLRPKRRLPESLAWHPVATLSDLAHTGMTRKVLRWLRGAVPSKRPAAS